MSRRQLSNHERQYLAAVLVARKLSRVCLILLLRVIRSAARTDRGMPYKRNAPLCNPTVPQDGQSPTRTGYIRVQNKSWPGPKSQLLADPSKCVHQEARGPAKRIVGNKQVRILAAPQMRSKSHRASEQDGWVGMRSTLETRSNVACAGSTCDP